MLRSLLTDSVCRTLLTLGWCCVDDDSSNTSPSPEDQIAHQAASEMAVNRRIFGLPSCCQPNHTTDTIPMSNCCMTAPDGEVIFIDTQAEKTNHQRSSPVMSDLWNESARNEGALNLEAQERVSPANFSGSWRCEEVSGDMEAFLSDMGLGSALRKAAATANYGAGQQVQNISQRGDCFEVENILRTPVTIRFRVGDGEQSTVDQVGKPIVVDPKWEGSSLWVTSRTQTGEAIADSKRFIDGDAMVIEFISPQGTKVQRIFSRV